MEKLILYFTCIIFIFTAIAASNVHADNMRETKAGIEFTTDMGPTNPVDPEDPSSPDPETEVEGDLAIVFVSPFNFGTKPILAGTKFYGIETIQPNIQVVDIRGTGKGWELRAGVSEFRDEEDQITLIGSIIHIKDGRLKSQASMAYAPTVHTNVELSVDRNEARVITADPGRGQGLWVDRLYPESTEDEALVQLEIPAGAASKGTHTATITWTLYITP